MPSHLAELVTLTVPTNTWQSLLASHQRVAPPSLPSGHNLARRKKGTVHGDDAIPCDDVIYVIDLVQIPREQQGNGKMGGMELGKKEDDDGSDSVKNDVHYCALVCGCQKEAQCNWFHMVYISAKKCPTGFK